MKVRELIEELKKRSGWKEQKDLAAAFNLTQGQAHQLEQGGVHWDWHFEVFMRVYPVARKLGLIPGRDRSIYHDALEQKILEMIEEAKAQKTDAEYRIYEQELLRDVKKRTKESGIFIPDSSDVRTVADGATRSSDSQYAAPASEVTTNGSGKKTKQAPSRAKRHHKGPRTAPAFKAQKKRTS